MAPELAGTAGHRELWHSFCGGWSTSRDQSRRKVPRCPRQPPVILFNGNWLRSTYSLAQNTVGRAARPRIEQLSRRAADTQRGVSAPRCPAG